MSDFHLFQWVKNVVEKSENSPAEQLRRELISIILAQTNELTMVIKPDNNREKFILEISKEVENLKGIWEIKTEIQHLYFNQDEDETLAFSSLDDRGEIPGRTHQIWARDLFHIRFPWLPNQYEN